MSHNELMVAMVNHAADPVWLAAWRKPETDKDWRELGRHALQLKIAGALLSSPGTGPKDAEWAADPIWNGWASALRDVGSDAIEAIGSRDQAAISKVGDRLVEVCEGCHKDFKPDAPTGGKFGELSPTESDFEGEGD